MTEIQLNFLNLNTFFLIGLIILIGGYLYYEIHKIKQVLNDYDYQLYQFKSTLEKLPLNDTITEDTITEDTITEDTITEDTITEDTIIEDTIIEDTTIVENENITTEDENDVWNEINNLMDKKEDNNLETLNVSDNDSSKLDNENLDELLNEMNDHVSDENYIPNYNNMTVSQLKNILVDMKLPVSGNKTKLIERINNNK
jgi:hypothetical protein